ncbi:GCN5 family acetyltransferase [Novosphingobium barchaimii LL02]|uniref:GCN5 family acetyltransferase n=1 Tax=Novosphingobium barchaimii LL02 TaxID=1114963 RepID=A0A0J7Y8J3_9SPHN|nr:GNAT family N-acetyltransferase [Novosphingobium barchaimii]KMS60156.1 GCN5 family acetyltransferase [Novosphingobium barchaimii LL02]
MSPYTWRPMGAADIDAVVAVAAACFPDHFEARACFEERLALFPQGCFALSSEGVVKGYLIAYPWPLGAIPPLNSSLGALPEERETFYLHDLALHPDVRGQGHARPIVERLSGALSAMEGRSLALVSVNDSVAFWRGMGFEPVVGDAAITRKLESYGGGSTYMVRAIGW